MRFQGVVVLFVAVVACGPTIPNTKYEGPGKQYCGKVATKHGNASSVTLGFGISLSLVSASLAILGPAMGPDERDGASWFSKNRNAMTTAVAGIVAIPAALLLASPLTAA